MDRKHHYVLYITGHSVDSTRLADVVRAALEQAFTADLELEIVDVLSSPERAAGAEVFVTPTLERRLPRPAMRLVGSVENLSPLLQPASDPAC